MRKYRLIFFLYTLVWFLAVPFLICRLGFRSWRLKAYRQRIWERFALRQVGGACDVWIHAVSVGEVMAAIVLIKAIQAKHSLRILITTMTPTGSSQVQRLLGNTVTHSYVPYDLPWVLKRFIRYYQPKLLVLLETEIWPNMIRYCTERHIPVMIANARLSKRSARQYAWLGAWRAELFSKLWIAAQTRAHAKRFAVLGCPSKQIVTTGSLKYDVQIDATQQRLATELKSYWLGRPTYIAASVHTGEAAIILESFLSLSAAVPDILLVLAPRHPERSDWWAKQCQQRGLTYQLRSDLTDVSKTAVLLVDTLGELLAFYASTDIAVVGGSFINHGGHNILEPAMVAKPIITGPCMFNFADIHQTFHNAQAMLTVEPSQLADTLVSLFADDSAQAAYGQRARRLALGQQGAVLTQQAMIEQLLLVHGHDI